MKEIKIVTKNGDMIGIETPTNVYYLRQPTPLSESEEYLSTIQKFETLFDTSLIETEEIEEEEEWTSISELKEFYDDKYAKTQAYFRILAERGDWVSTREILKEMEQYGFKDMVSQSISGIRSGNTKSYRSWEKEPLDDREWLGDEWQNHYRIKPKYLEILRNAINQ